MNKNMVLIVDKNSHRVENLQFMVRLGGYETRIFENTAAALNWIKYAGHAAQILCLLFNHPQELENTEKIFTEWVGSGMIVPVVLVQRGKGNSFQLPMVGEMDHFFVCVPENIMQTLDILSVIEYSPNCDGVDTDEAYGHGEVQQ